MCAFLRDELQVSMIPRKLMRAVLHNFNSLLRRLPRIVGTQSHDYMCYYD